MALKSKEWFYKECLLQIKDRTRLYHLCWDILMKGIGQSDKTRGHVTQSIGVCQKFLNAHLNLIDIIKNSDPTRPFDVSKNKDVRDALKAWLPKRNGPFGRTEYGYNYDTLKKILTQSLGGTRKGGGGGNDEFKRVLRIMVEFHF